MDDETDDRPETLGMRLDRRISDTKAKLQKLEEIKVKLSSGNPLEILCEDANEVTEYF